MSSPPAAAGSPPGGFRHRQVPAGGGSLHVVEAGDPGGQPFLFLHGWPESWQCWQQIMTVAARAGRPAREAPEETWRLIAAFAQL